MYHSPSLTQYTKQQQFGPSGLHDLLLPLEPAAAFTGHAPTLIAFHGQAPTVLACHGCAHTLIAYHGRPPPPPQGISAVEGVVPWL